MPAVTSRKEIDYIALNMTAKKFKNSTVYSVFTPKEFIEEGRRNGLTPKSSVDYIKANAFRIAHGKYTFNDMFDNNSVMNHKVDLTATATKQSPQSTLKQPWSTTQQTQNSVEETKRKIAAEAAEAAAKAKSKVVSEEQEIIDMPFNGNTFVKWGHFKDVGLIVASKQFFPVYITGESGNGKTLMVEEACKATKRELVRVQISPETCEDDLIGGFRLINGETVFEKGPVIRAMDMGAVLLIDEIDRGSNNIMCLQGVLEGKPVMIKKTGEVVVPKPGFNVIATSNTKGKGSDDGRYIAATIIDESFLERFMVTFVQPFPPKKVELAILNKKAQSLELKADQFIIKLSNWSEIIRTTYEKNGINEVVSTRRLCAILATYAIFNDERKAIALCINKFDSDTQIAMMDLYSKLR